ncbi:hypothetical protein M1D68_14650 [Pseudomonas sp. R4-84]
MDIDVSGWILLKKKETEVSFFGFYILQWKSIEKYLERETRLVSGVRLIEIYRVSFLAEAGKDLILDLFLGCFKDQEGGIPGCAISFYL